MLEHGHPLAARYPVRMVWEEAELINERTNAREAVRAQLFHMAISATPNMAVKGGINKQASKDFKKVVDALLKG